MKRIPNLVDEKGEFNTYVNDIDCFFFFFVMVMMMMRWSMRRWRCFFRFFVIFFHRYFLVFLTGQQVKFLSTVNEVAQLFFPRFSFFFVSDSVEGRKEKIRERWERKWNVLFRLKVLSLCLFFFLLAQNSRRKFLESGGGLSFSKAGETTVKYFRKEPAAQGRTYKQN